MADVPKTVEIPTAIPVDLEAGGIPPPQMSPQNVNGVQAQQVNVHIAPIQQTPQVYEPPMPGSWVVGLCGCFQDMVPNCCMPWLCPCVSTAQIAKRLGVSSYCCGLGLSVLFLWLGLFPCWVCHLRTATRERFRIPGNCCGDYCEAFWCTSCAVAQIATRAGSYKPGNCSFGSLDTLPPYKPM
ncbi:hypothetical protein PF011_g17227 [Phytophthora fragariae]|uniref:PLAC8 family protein n=1 Tax=Phytophthora fragariae TaxID=53985 RepID=A0A6A3JDK7_9STRA|nr:hypothetical protein PF011_g17227 [Phytophthora fragariae]